MIENETTTRTWEQAQRRRTRKLILLALARYADALGICWPSIDTLAALIGETVDYTRQLAREAEDDGDLVRRPGVGRGNPTIYGICAGLDVDTRHRLAVIVQHTLVRKGVRYLELDGERFVYEPGMEDALFGAAIVTIPTGDDGKGVPQSTFSRDVKNPVRQAKHDARQANARRPPPRPARRPPPEPDHIRWLREDEGITTARDFEHLDPVALIEDYKNRRAEGQPKGAIVKYWKQYPPTPKTYYRGKNHAADQQNRPPSRGPRPGDSDYYN
jgi:hypothetical protein